MKPTVFAATLERLTEIESSYGVSEEKQKQRTKTAKILANATLNNTPMDYNEISKYCSQIEMIHNMKVHLMQLFENAVSLEFFGFSFDFFYKLNLQREKMHPPYPSETDVQSAIKQLVNIAVHNLWDNSTDEEPTFVIKPQDPIGRAIAVIGKLDELTEQQLINGHR